MISTCHNLLIFPCFALTPASFDKSTQATSKQRVGGSSPSGRATSCRSNPDTWVTQRTGYIGKLCAQRIVERCRVPPSARRRATNCSLSSMTEHSFQGIAFSPKGKKRNLCVRYDLLPMCWVAQCLLQRPAPLPFSYFELKIRT